MGDERRCWNRLFGWRRPWRRRADDSARRRTAGERRRNPPRPTDRPTRARGRAQRSRADRRRQDRRRQAGASGSHERADDRARIGRSQRRSAEGGRPVRLRARRRGSDRLPRARDPRRSRPGCNCGDRSHGLRRHPCNAARRLQRRRLRHRPREPREAGDADRLACAGRLPWHARLLHGRAQPWADCRGANKWRPPRRAARSSDRARNIPGSARSRWHARDDRPDS